LIEASSAIRLGTLLNKYLEDFLTLKIYLFDFKTNPQRCQIAFWQMKNRGGVFGEDI